MSDPSYSSKHLLGWIWRDYLRKHWPILLVAVVFMFLEGSTLGAISYMLQPMFDQVFIGGNSGALWWVGVAILVIFSIRAIAGLVQKVLLTRVAQLTAADIRVDLLNHMMKQDGAFHQTHPPGYLIQRVQSDVNAVNDVWRAIITGAGRDVVALIVLMGVAISVDWKWAIMACIGTPLLIAPEICTRAGATGP